MDMYGVFAQHHFCKAGKDERMERFDEVMIGGGAQRVYDNGFFCFGKR